MPQTMMFWKEETFYFSFDMLFVNFFKMSLIGCEKYHDLIYVCQIQTQLSKFRVYLENTKDFLHKIKLRIKVLDTIPYTFANILTGGNSTCCPCSKVF